MMNPTKAAAKLKQTKNKLELRNPSFLSSLIIYPDIIGTNVIERVWKKHKQAYPLPLIFYGTHNPTAGKLIE